MLCEAESLRGTPQTRQSTVIVLRGIVDSPLRPTGLCAGFLMNRRGFGAVLKLSDTERNA